MLRSPPPAPPPPPRRRRPPQEYDLPFGQRYEVRLKYYNNLPEQPLYYRHAPPQKVACCYSFNAYWTAIIALHPYWFKEFGLDRWCRQVGRRQRARSVELACVFLLRGRRQ